MYTEAMNYIDKPEKNNVDQKINEVTKKYFDQNAGLPVKSADAMSTDLKFFEEKKLTIQSKSDTVESYKLQHTLFGRINVIFSKWFGTLKTAKKEIDNLDAIVAKLKAEIGKMPAAPTPTASPGKKPTSETVPETPQDTSEGEPPSTPTVTTEKLTPREKAARAHKAPSPSQMTALKTGIAQLETTIEDLLDERIAGLEEEIAQLLESGNDKDEDRYSKLSLELNAAKKQKLKLNKK
jgi:hypothetical protein